MKLNQIFRISYNVVRSYQTFSEKEAFSKIYYFDGLRLEKSFRWALAYKIEPYAALFRYSVVGCQEINRTRPPTQKKKKKKSKLFSVDGSIYVYLTLICALQALAITSLSSGCQRHCFRLSMVLCIALSTTIQWIPKSLTLSKTWENIIMTTRHGRMLSDEITLSFDLHERMKSKWRSEQTLVVDNILKVHKETFCSLTKKFCYHLE